MADRSQAETDLRTIASHLLYADPEVNGLFMSIHLLNDVTIVTLATSIATSCCLLAPAQAGAAALKAGVARASINPMEDKIPTPLGGYGAREGKPAQGTLEGNDFRRERRLATRGALIQDWPAMIKGSGRAKYPAPRKPAS